MDRREFLKLCAMAGLGLAAPIGLTRRAFAEDGIAEGPFFLVFNAEGGWDTSYLMDPKGVNDINALYREGDILTQGAHTFAPNAASINRGMSNEDFYARYGNELLTLNGLDYSVNNHQPGQCYMATGKLDSLAYPTFAALLAASKGNDAPLAYISFGNYSGTGNLTPLTRLSNIGELSRISSPDNQNGTDNRPYFDEDFLQARINQALREEHEVALGTPRLPRTTRSQSMLFAAQLNSGTLGRIRPFLPPEEPAEPLSKQVNIALAGFKSGVCLAANINRGGFDTHRTNDTLQMEGIPELLAGIDFAARRAEELGIRDQVVFVIQSEMGRTPWYNDGQGKDHWSIGSVMFMGAGIRGNRVLGATDDGQMLSTINPQTLAIDTSAAGIRVRPEHIHRSLREFTGIYDHPMSQQFPLAVSDEERLVDLF